MLKKISINLISTLIGLVVLTVGLHLYNLPEVLAANPILRNVGLSSMSNPTPTAPPVTIAAGETMRVYYYVDNPNSTSQTYGLGISIINPNSQEIIDHPHDVTISIPANAQDFLVGRTFDIPQSAITGSYAVIFALWNGRPGEPGSTQIASTKTIKTAGYLKVTAPIASPTPSPTPTPTPSPTTIYFSSHNATDTTLTATLTHPNPWQGGTAFYMGASIYDKNGTLIDLPLKSEGSWSPGTPTMTFTWSLSGVATPVQQYRVSMWDNNPDVLNAVRLADTGWVTVTTPTPPPTAPICSPASQSVETGIAANLTATSGDGSYSWSAPGGTPSSGTGSSFSVSYSTTGTKTVTVTSAGGHTASCTVNVTAPPSTNIPVTPSNFTATPISTSQINLKWQDNSNNETGFKIERRTGSSTTWAQIATAGTNITSYSNTSLTAATTYYYRLRAYNSYGNSAYVETSATTPFLPPIANLLGKMTASRTRVAYGNMFSIKVELTSSEGDSHCVQLSLKTPYGFTVDRNRTSYYVTKIANGEMRSFIFYIFAPYSSRTGNNIANFYSDVIYSKTPKCDESTSGTLKLGPLGITVERGYAITFVLYSVKEGLMSVYEKANNSHVSTFQGVATSPKGPTQIQTYLIPGNYIAKAHGWLENGQNACGEVDFAANAHKTVGITMKVQETCVIPECQYPDCIIN